MRIGQRKHDRFVTDDSAFAALGRNYTKIGKIKDISLGGLAFEYIAGEDGNQAATEVDIFLVGNVFQLYNVQCKIVYDIDVHTPHVNSEYIKTLITKRCGLAFRKLTEEEIFELKLFLQVYATGLA